MPELVRPDEYAGEEAVRKQRVGAYGVLLRPGPDDGPEQMLLTRISPTDYGAGMWTLPGGGLDHGEDPADGVVREVYEESGLRVHPLRVRLVYSAHFYGRNRAGVLEDFHGLSIVYDVEADPGIDLDALHIVEEDSSTDLVEWLTPVEVFDRRTGEFDRPFVSMAQTTIADALGVAGFASPDQYRAMADPREPRPGAE